MKAVVLCATRGSQLGPLTASRPKAMSIVAGETLLANHLEELRSSGITAAHLVTGYYGEQVKEQFGSGSSYGLRLHYHRQEQQTGIGNALHLVRSALADDDWFVLVYADHITPDSLSAKVLQYFSLHQRPVAAVALSDSNNAYGNVFLDDGTRISQLIEKPDDEGMGNYVLSGVFVLPTKVFDFLDEANGSMEGALQLLIERDTFRAVLYDGAWIDISYPWTLLRANRIVMDSWQAARIHKDAIIEGNVSISGPVHIEPGVTIKAGSVLQGPCYIGEESFIGNNTLIRPYTSVGPGCTVGYGVELKNCIMYGGSVVGRLSFVGDSIVGEKTMVGSGVMTVNVAEDFSNIPITWEGERRCSGQNKLGSFIGDRATIGAGNTLGPGTVVPAGATIPHHLSYRETELSQGSETDGDGRN